MKRTAIFTLAVCLSSGAFAQDMPLGRDDIASFEQPSYSPYAGRGFPTKLLFGDTPRHTNLFLDARVGGVILSPSDAFRFARGEEVTASGGFKVRIGQPLDFLVVTDHSPAPDAIRIVAVRGHG